MFLLFLWFFYKWRQQPNHNTHYRDVESLRDYRIQSIRSDSSRLHAESDTRKVTEKRSSDLLARSSHELVESLSDYRTLSTRRSGIQRGGTEWGGVAERNPGRKGETPLVRQGGGGEGKVLRDLSNVPGTGTSQHIQPTCSSAESDTRKVTKKRSLIVESLLDFRRSGRQSQSAAGLGGGGAVRGGGRKGENPLIFLNS